MKRIPLFIALFAAVFLPFAASAATFRSGQTVDLAAADTVDGNLYAAGGMLSLGADVSGDLYAAGGNMSLTGGVTQDLVVAGGNITMLGQVGGDLRAAGGSLVIGSAVGGELLVAGGNLTVLPDATVGGDATFAVGEVTLKGDVAGDLEARGRQVRIDGTVEGNVHVVAESLTVASGAVIKGSLLFEGPQQAVFEDGAVVQGEKTYSFKEFSRERWHEGREIPLKSLGKAFAGAFFMLVLVKFLAFLLGAVVATVWCKRASRTVVGHTLGNFGADFLTGFIVMIVAPIAVILLFATVIGWLFAVMLIAFLMLATFAAGVFTVISFGALVRKLFTKSKHYEADWKSAVLGTVLLTLVMLVPFVGWLFGCVFYVACLGAVLRISSERCRSEWCSG